MNGIMLPVIRHAAKSSIDGGPSPYTLEQIKETKALAWGMVKHIDDCIGEIMKHLEETGKKKIQ